MKCRHFQVVIVGLLLSGSSGFMPITSWAYSEDTTNGGTHAKVCEDVLFEVVASYGELTRNYAV